MCHRKIRDGAKFCDNCKQKRKNKADESYLDSLLNSVAGNQTPPKKQPEPDYYPEEELENGAYFDQNGNTGYDDGSAMANPDSGMYGSDVNPMEGMTDFGDMTGSDPNTMGIDEGISGNPMEMNGDFAASGEPYENGIDVGSENSGASDEMDDMLSDILQNMDEAEPQAPESDIREEDIENIFDEAEAYAALLNNEGNAEAEPGASQDDGMFDTAGEGQSGDLSSSEFDIPDDTPGNEGGTPEGFGQEEQDSDLIDIGWNDSGENPGSEDGQSQDYEEDPDAALDEILLNAGLQGENADYSSAEEAFSGFNPIEEEISKEEKPKKKKLSWFRRLFGNVNDEVTPEMIEADRIKKAEEEEQAKKEKEEKKKKNEEKKAQAQKEKERKKAEADAARNKKLALAIEKKNAAKEKAKKKKEQQLAIAEYELEHGKINKAGATILFVIFAILTIVIIIGTNIYSYNLSIENAQKDFEVKKYNEAYYEVYGLKIQDEDIELYDKIMTVMYVNTQLNSYEHYMKSNNREKALDSLLKGLQRYDKYLQLAQRLGITDDLNYVKGKLLEKLQTEFNLTEIEAYKMVEIDDSVDYSEYLYELLGNYDDLEEVLENHG